MTEPSTSSAAGARPGAAAKPVRLFQKQPNMLRVIYALIPVAASAVYFFGWRVLWVLAACNAAGLITERITSRSRKAPISMACFVTCWLYALSLPPTVPIFVAVVGVVVGILFGKEVFGGFGRNFANPAITGRAFVYICFPVDLTGRFAPAFKGWPGGFAHWSIDWAGLPDYLAQTGRSVADAIGRASPMWVAEKFGFDVLQSSGKGASIWDMLLGAIGGTFQVPGEAAPRILAGGSMGEGCALLIVLAGAYLLWTKTANWRLMLSGLGGLIAANVVFRNVLGFSGLGQVPPLEWQLLSGTTLYVVVFMITDPVSAAKRRPAQWAYGFLIGFLIVVLRWRGVFVAAASFAVLLGNLVGPLLDLGVDEWAAWRKARPAGPAEGDGE